MRRLAAFLAFAAVLASAGPAFGANLYVEPGGDGPVAPPESRCPSSDPCSLTDAIGAADAGDVLLLTGGPYPFSGTLAIDEAVTIQPESSTGTVTFDSTGTLPMLDVTAAATLRRIAFTGAETLLTVDAAADGAVLEDLRLTQDAGSTAPVLVSAADLVARRLVVSGIDAGLQLSGGNPLVTDSIVLATAAGASAVQAGTGSDAALVHVTAWAPGAGGTGVELDGTSPELEIVNSIVRGAGTDIDAATGTVTVTRTNYDPAKTSGTVTGTGGSQSGDPQLDGDLRPAATSPVVGAGDGDPRAGAIDIAGAPRVACGKPDLGAYELQTCPDDGDDGDGDGDGDQNVPPPNPPAPPPVVVQTPPITLPGLLAGDFTDPALGSLTVTADRRRRLTARLNASEPVLVRFVVEKRISGRRSGSQCVRGRKTGRRCTRWVVVRRLTRSLGSGVQRTSLGKLSAGTYRVTARGQDSWRNQSRRERDTVSVRARRG